MIGLPLGPLMDEHVSAGVFDHKILMLHVVGIARGNSEKSLWLKSPPPHGFVAEISFLTEANMYKP